MRVGMLRFAEPARRDGRRAADDSPASGLAHARRASTRQDKPCLDEARIPQAWLRVECDGLERFLLGHAGRNAT